MIDESIPHHVGHRDRLRARFNDGGTDALADYELLELLLFTAIPRKDVKPIAKDLIATFGTLHKMMAAPVGDMVNVKGISENTAIFLKSVHALQNRALQRDVTGKPVLSNWDRLIDYCHSTMAEDDVERFRVLYLNKKNELLLDEVHASGTIDSANIYTREVLKKSMNIGATALILVHNHPSGDPAPSQPDIDITYALVEAAKPLGIAIHDHIIIARKGHCSLKTMGLLL
jgi:DNA repair protein RadC